MLAYLNMVLDSYSLRSVFAFVLLLECIELIVVFLQQTNIFVCVMVATL